MTQKGRTIQLQKSTVTDLMSHLSGLPEREKGPDDPVSLPEIFRTKEYMSKIRGALKKGYTFEDLARLFSERCGIDISARQLKYHFTRGTKRGLKKRLDKGGDIIPAYPDSNGTLDSATPSTHSPAEKNHKVTEQRPDKGTAANAKKAGAFAIEMNPDEI